MSNLIDVAVTGWKLDDAAGGAKVLAKSGPALSADEKEILAGNLREIDARVTYLKHIYNDAEAAAKRYDAAAQQVADSPDTVAEPKKDDPSFLDEHGDVLEHIWDFVNQITQMMLVVGDLHLIAGTDVIKDAIKNDQIDKEIAAIHDDLDKQRSALNAVIDVTKKRAKADAENAADEFASKVDELKDAMSGVQAAVAGYAQSLKTFEKKNAGKKGLSKEAELVLRTYNAVLQASVVSQTALNALKTRTLGPSAYKTWVKQLVPLGKPITDDSKTGGASLFEKGSTVVRYTQPSKVVEALASGLEDVDAVYDDAPKIDGWAKAWKSAIQDFSVTGA